MKANYHPERFGRNEVFQGALGAFASWAGDLAEEEYESLTAAISAPGAKALKRIAVEGLEPFLAQALVESLLMKLTVDLAYAGVPAEYAKQCVMAFSDAFAIVAMGVDWSQ